MEEKPERVWLNHLIYDKATLSDGEIEALVKLIGDRCRQKTKDRLRRRLRYLSLIQPAGILGRVMVRPRVEYVAGQSYPDEIRIVRNVILDS
jgi:hypothetical protein